MPLITTGISRFDAWVNQALGFGTTRDKTAYSIFAYDGDLTDDALTGLYEGNDIARTIVSIVPEEMFRLGVVITHAQKEELVKAARDLALLPKIQEAMIWGRLFGGGIAVLGLDDGRKASEEFNEASLRDFRYIDVYDKTQLRIAEWYADKTEHRYGKAAVFEVTDLTGRVFKVHETRCLVFGGVHTTKRTKYRRQGWDLSVLQAMHDVLRSFGTTFQSLEHLLLDASVGVYRLKGLIAKLGTPKGKEELSQRATIMDLYRNSSRSIILDSQDEDYTRVSTAFSGLDAPIQAFIVRLAAAAKIPVTVLMGQSPAGLNATGASDVRLFYSRIETEQEQILPDITRLYSLLARAKRMDPIVKIAWPSLWSETPPEKAAREKTEAEADGMNITNQILLPEEVTRIRFTGRPEVDMSLRTGGKESGTIVLTPSDAANVITVNEARASMALDPLPGPDGLLTLAAYAAKNAPKPAIVPANGAA